uniref:Cuticlin-1 n=1 Tax=Ascaris suum TaxID=6253 RepID=F1LAE5_ASCSU
MPTCKYEVLKGGADGEPLKYAIIGEVVYHKWTCSGVYDNIYCMTVHSCMVDDGQGNRHEILDEMGCCTDRYLLNDLEYLDQLSAGQEAQVFKFADRPSVFFSCQIRLLSYAMKYLGNAIAHPIYERNQKEAQKKIKQTQIYQVRQFYHELILRQMNLRGIRMKRTWNTTQKEGDRKRHQRGNKAPQKPKGCRKEFHVKRHITLQSIFRRCHTIG